MGSFHANDCLVWTNSVDNFSHEYLSSTGVAAAINKEFACGLTCLDHLYVRGFFALRAIAFGKTYTLVFSQALEAICSDVLEVDKQVVAAAIRCNEAEALGIVEPFDDAGLIAHSFFPLYWNSVECDTNLCCAHVVAHHARKKLGSQTGIALGKSQRGKRPTVINLLKCRPTVHHIPLIS